MAAAGGISHRHKAMRSAISTGISLIRRQLGGLADLLFRFRVSLERRSASTCQRGRFEGAD
jgi:hypothetical protein